MSKKHDIEYIKKLFESKGVELLDEVYISYNSPLKFRCACGNEHRTSPYNLTKGKNKCPLCYKVKKVESLKLLEDDVYNYIKDKGFIVKSPYVNIKEKMNLTCPAGHSIFVSFRSFRQSKGACRICYFKNNKGENHHSYKHGRSKEDREDRNKSRVKHNEWKRLVLEKCGYSCVICGVKNGKNMPSHHLNGYNWDKENRYNPENGVILCKLHHDHFHRIYGKGDNTKEQFEEYLNGYKINKNPWNKEFLCQ